MPPRTTLLCIYTSMIRLDHRLYVLYNFQKSFAHALAASSVASFIAIDEQLLNILGYYFPLQAMPSEVFSHLFQIKVCYKYL